MSQGKCLGAACCFSWSTVARLSSREETQTLLTCGIAAGLVYKLQDLSSPRIAGSKPKASSQPSPLTAS